MNRWKFSFFVLAGLVAAAFAALIVLLGVSSESAPLPKMEVPDRTDHVLTLTATKEDLEGIANTYIQKAVNGEPLPVTMEIGDDVVLISELNIFSFTLPVLMHFDPIVQQDGNLILKQSSMEIGQLNIQPAVVLKILRDSVKLPEWMIVRPEEEELFINLSEIPLSDNLQIKAKTFNLADDEINFEIYIPKE